MFFSPFFFPALGLLRYIGGAVFYFFRLLLAYSGWACGLFVLRGFLWKLQLSGGCSIYRRFLCVLCIPIVSPRLPSFLYIPFFSTCFCLALPRCFIAFRLQQTQPLSTPLFVLLFILVLHSSCYPCLISLFIFVCIVTISGWLSLRATGHYSRGTNSVPRIRPTRKKKMKTEKP